MAYRDYNYDSMTYEEMSEYYKLAVIKPGETPLDWKERIWERLMYFKNNNKLNGPRNCYLIARKMVGYNVYTPGGRAEKTNIAICFSCEQLVYIKLGAKYPWYYDCQIEDHWLKCKGNEFSTISFEKYMEIKHKSNDNLYSFDSHCRYHYEIWMKNATTKLKRALVAGKQIRAVKIIQNKWLEYMYRPEGLKAVQLAMHYELIRGIRQEKLQSINA
jgi:hypothetical protein